MGAWGVWVYVRASLHAVIRHASAHEGPHIRPKFRFVIKIGVRHGCMGVWVYGCMGAWVHGCMYVRASLHTVLRHAGTHEGPHIRPKFRFVVTIGVRHVAVSLRLLLCMRIHPRV